MESLLLLLGVALLFLLGVTLGVFVYVGRIAYDFKKRYVDTIANHYGRKKRKE